MKAWNMCCSECPTCHGRGTVKRWKPSAMRSCVKCVFITLMTPIAARFNSYSCGGGRR
ncbi:hypothetical protein KCP75_17855 [Salmonella enterica subsp. enterica]|nr:hypothetical protein KCP75_17855 [Salmonella enterica subsp. enterica]